MEQEAISFNVWRPSRISETRPSCADSAHHRHDIYPSRAVRADEIFAASWPKFPDEDDPVASKLSTLPKYVVSTTLENADWQPTTIIRGDIAAEVAKLKEQYEGEIQVHGSAGLTQTLHTNGLIDEYRLFIEPVVLGTGKRLFEPSAAPTALRLVDNQPMGKGTVLAVYQPAGKPTYVSSRWRRASAFRTDNSGSGFRRSPRRHPLLRFTSPS